MGWAWEGEGQGWEAWGWGEGWRAWGWGPAGRVVGGVATLDGRAHSPLREEADGPLRPPAAG